MSKPSLLTLLLLVSYPSVGAVLFTPALPDIAQFFHITSGSAQFTITLFLIGYALGQLPYGPISNKIGRKNTLYIGIAISILGALLCALAGQLSSYWFLLVARVITALGASVGLMMSLTIISDYYEPVTARKQLGYIIIAFAIAPGAAVALGGFLTHAMGWESTFYFQAIYGVVAGWLAWRLPETSTCRSDEKLTLKWIIDSYLKRCRNPKLILCAFIQGCCTSFVYIFAALGPFLLIHVLGLTPQNYGLLNLIPSVGMVLGSFLSRATHRYISPHRSILLGLMLMLSATVAMLLAFVYASFNLWTLFVPYFFINMGIALAYINCPAIGTSDAKNKPNASAVLACINISCCVVIVFFVQGIDSQKPFVMPVLFLLLLAILFPLYRKLEKRITSA